MPPWLDREADTAILRPADGFSAAGSSREGAIDEAADGIASSFSSIVRPEWIDNNGHMNMGYYLVVFDLATDEWMRRIGLDAAHRRAQGVTTFCLEAHVTYHREVREGDALRFTTRLLAHDAKRIHYIHEMFHRDAGYLAATNELMSLHVSQATRRGAPMTPAILARLAALQRAHDRLPRPAQVGRVMGLAAPPTTR